MRAKLSFLVVVVWAAAAYAGTVAEWDFTKGTLGWAGNKQVEALASSKDGLVFKSTGTDPWIEGPAVDLPGDPAKAWTRVRIRMKSTGDVSGELFYGQTFRAGHSVPFTVRNDGQWHDYSVIIREDLGAGTHFRLDPCAGPGEVAVGSMRVEKLSKVVAPPMEKPDQPDKSGGVAGSVRSGALVLEHYVGRWGNFAVKIDDAEMASGYQGELIGIVSAEQPQWLNLNDAKVTFEKAGQRQLEIRAVIQDTAGGTWQVRRQIGPGEHEGTIVVQTEFKVDKDREVIHLPWLTLFPGLGSFGESKYQGLFAGLEYLGNEPSSSEADITTAEHIRRVPDPVKVTFPLMAIVSGGRYVGLIWEPSDTVAPVFDSPDRICNSGAHLMAISGPAVGELRFENELVAHTPMKLEADKPIKAQVLIIGGKDKTVVGAVKDYVAIKGLPEVPQFEGGFESAVVLLSRGWLESAIRQGGLFRHAVWGDSFGPSPAADAAMFIDWLANNLPSGYKNLVPQFESTRDQAIANAGQALAGSVSHTRPPTAPLVFGGIYPYVQHRRGEAMSMLANFDESGIRLYKPGRTDYGKTHFERHANGLAGGELARILEGAALSGDKELISKALELLDKQTRLYADTVPRGAQTWEVPLHTPDILAAAHLVRVYALGYIISGKEEYLGQARYWAWTGVPFVYLHNPAAGKVGPYATIAVLGATNWQAPVWLGQPVQWCGLVYCSALHLLSQYDKQGPWERIAKGITSAGLQMSWPVTDASRQGLLPDVFDLRAQLGAGPAINPGTVQAHVPELYGKGRIYDLKRLAKKGWFVHAPCLISDIRESEDSATFIVDGWAGSDKSFYVLVSGAEKQPSEAKVRKVAAGSQQQSGFQPTSMSFNAQYKLMAIPLAGKSEIQIRY